ncbi:MAG TPA: DUF389 domain-containing protein [Chitinophagales bacterium]|nr:DUF389 domain-containing protein [Chitinophagales bacterium]
MENILDNFKLNREKEDYENIIASIDRGVVFRGTNLWVLIFAIFVASLGLNVNSTAVIIGAMLISPLMGPIMGLGLAMAINDLALLRKAWFNYAFAFGVSLAASTLYFLLSPINAAHSEILARTSPNIYDVLIAFFGGLAGIVATSSKQKGNVIPGVAIATALMPPICTAGYGLATGQFSFFFGALYLFIINTVFIALAVLVTARILKFPFKHLPDAKAEKQSQRIVWAVVLITLLPSIYFGYDIVQQGKFEKNAEKFIEAEAVFANDYLLKKEINPKKKYIELVFGGKKIEDVEIESLKNKLKAYDLQNATLDIKQGFAYINETKDNTAEDQLNKALAAKVSELQAVKLQLDSIHAESDFMEQLQKEARAINPNFDYLALAPLNSTDSTDTLRPDYIVYVKLNKPVMEKDKKQLEQWLLAKLNKKIKTIFDR